MPKKNPSPGDIEAGMTANGGFTRAQLAEWGVPWPPPKGWRARLEAAYDEEVQRRTSEELKLRWPSIEAGMTMPCDDCGVDTKKNGEFYGVNDDVWPAGATYLCIGCLEKRIGRVLVPEDFPGAYNELNFKTMSARLRDRLGHGDVEVYSDDTVLNYMREVGRPIAPTIAMLRANAAVIAKERYERPRGALVGAPSHSAAFLLRELELAGWQLTRRDDPNA